MILKAFSARVQKRLRHKTVPLMEVLAIIHFLQKGGDMQKKILNIIELILVICDAALPIVSYLINK